MIRLMSGAALAVMVLAALWWLPPAALLPLVLAVAALAFAEYARIADGIGARVPWWPTLAATLAVCAMVPFPWVAVESVLAAALIATAGSVLLSDRASRALVTDSAAAMLAPVYLGLPLGSLVGIHAVSGRLAVILLIATVAVSDSAQYYAGRLFGRTPLSPRHSPKKTREGALGGFVAAPLFLVLAGRAWMPDVSPAALVVLGVALVAAGIIGDLFESMLKRAADLKDSGALIPGHGGILDRIDALLFAAPVFYFFLRTL